MAAWSTRLPALRQMRQQQLSWPFSRGPLPPQLRPHSRRARLVSGRTWQCHQVARAHVTLTRADAHSHLELLAAGDFSTNDLWLAFVNWMAYFFPDEVMKQQIAEVALRRAQLLN